MAHQGPICVCPNGGEVTSRSLLLCVLLVGACSSSSGGNADGAVRAGAEADGPPQGTGGALTSSSGGGGTVSTSMGGSTGSAGTGGIGGNGSGGDATGAGGFNVGGTALTGGTTAAGSSNVGGSAIVGGTTAGGGAGATGGRSTTGGRAVTGGLGATGGTLTGGSPGTGGTAIAGGTTGAGGTVVSGGTIDGGGAGAGGSGGVFKQDFKLIDPVGDLAFPVSSGIPFPQGALGSKDQVRLLDGQGSLVPAHFSEIAKWPDGSVKSLLVDFVAPPAMTSYRIEYGPGVSPTVAPAVATLVVDTSAPSAIVITSGHLRVSVSKQSFTIFQQVWLDQDNDGTFTDAEKLLSGPGDIVAVGNYGAATPQTFRSALATAADGYSLTVEELGPFKVVLLAKGLLKGTANNADGEPSLTAFEIRLHFWAGSDVVRMFYTLVDPKPRDMNGKVARATYPSRLQRVLDIRELDLRLPLALSAPSYAFGGAGTVHAGQASDEVYLLQDATRKLTEKIETSFDYSGVGKGDKAEGWLDLSQDTTRGIAAGVRHFWQQFPKELRYTPSSQEMAVSLQPARSKRPVPWEAKANNQDNTLFSLYPGIAKTFETFFFFHTGSATQARADAVGKAFQQPPLLFSSPWFCASGVFGPLVPDDSRQADYDRIVAGTWLWKDRQGFSDGPGYRVYGNRDFGDYLHTIDENIPMFGDLHYEDPRGDLLQFLRSGDRKWLENAVAGARHHMDLDVMHVNSVDSSSDVDEVQRGLGPGQIHWHNQYEHEMGGQTHEGHMVPGGLAEYYLLSGERRALEVLREQGDWLAAYANRKAFDLSEREFEEQRSHGWPLHALVESYLGSGDVKYLDGAAIIVANSLWWWQHPHQHVVKSPDSTKWQDVVETLDYTKGNSAWITNMRTDNCPEGNFTVSNWMAQYLIWGNLQWLEAARALHPTDSSYTLSGSYLGPTSIDFGQVEEMLVQNTRFIVETQWLDKDYTPRYPWLVGYDAHSFVYSPCIQDYPPDDGSSDADEVLPYLLLQQAKWSRVPATEQTKWKDIAAKMYKKEWTDNTESACYGYNGAPCMIAQPHFLALF
jgi:hypothetical protein